MALLKTDVEWHDIQIDPDDLPGEDEQVLITIETLSGNRMVWMDVYLREDSQGKPWFCTEHVDEFGLIQTDEVWYPVIAWAYPPAPYTYR